MKKIILFCLVLFAMLISNNSIAQENMSQDTANEKFPWESVIPQYNNVGFTVSFFFWNRFSLQTDYNA